MTGMSVIHCGHNALHMSNGNLSAVPKPAEDIFTYISSSQSLLDEDRAILVTGVQGYVAVHGAFSIAR